MGLKFIRTKDYKDRIIIDNGGDRLHFLGEIREEHSHGSAHIYGVDYFKPELVTDDSILYIHNASPISDSHQLYKEDDVISTAPLNMIEYTKALIDAVPNQRLTEYIITTPEKAIKLARYAKLAAHLAYLYKGNPLYENIVVNGELVDLSKIILTAEKSDDYINLVTYAGYNLKQLEQVAERILSYTKTEESYDLLTQESQVELFLNLANQKQSKLTELVDDDFITTMMKSQAYHDTVKHLITKGYKLSKTQQFNVLQHVGLFLGQSTPIVYNLSDMGAGKTLMTVQSIVLLNQYMMDVNKDRRAALEATVEQIEGRTITYHLPQINIIAPTLSLESSWIDTFRIFYQLTQDEENKHIYHYELNNDGITYYGVIQTAGFTVKNGNVTVKNKITPSESSRDYLIIDEIHQIINRKIKPSKFFDKNQNIWYKNNSFIISGTIANLTSAQWFNYLEFMSIPPSQYGLSGSSHYDWNRYIENLTDKIYKDVQQMAETIESEQHRIFDPSLIDEEQTEYDETKMTSKELLFHLTYSPVVLDLRNKDIKQALINRQYDILVGELDVQAPNFDLFYQLVSTQVVTAESSQVAEELYGKLPIQHKAQIIKTTSPLNSDDIDILKTIHHLIDAAHIYKSQAIAKKLGDAILNINDGLQSKNLYELLNELATKNMKFLEYLTTLDVSLLEKIQNSNLINTPKFEETEKFAILKDILEKDANETFLIVVNNIDTAIAMSKELGIKSITKRESTDELNYQYIIDELYKKQSIVIVPQHMIKSSLDLVQANRLIQYQLNTEISDIIQTQNRINRIGQTRETKAYYIATDELQENLIEMFLDTYRNIKVAHKGILELFVDLDQQVDVVSDYIGRALQKVTTKEPLFSVDGRILNITQFNYDNYSQSQAFLVYHNQLIGKSKDGKALFIANVDESYEKPALAIVSN